MATSRRCLCTGHNSITVRPCPCPSHHPQVAQAQFSLEELTARGLLSSTDCSALMLMEHKGSEEVYTVRGETGRGRVPDLVLRSVGGPWVGWWDARWCARERQGQRGGVHGEGKDSTRHVGGKIVKRPAAMTHGSVAGCADADGAQRHGSDVYTGRRGIACMGVSNYCRSVLNDPWVGREDCSVC